jgi:uncharacterized delta-60 repeat protein
MSAAWWARAGCLVAVVLSLAAIPTAARATLRLDTGFSEDGIARVSFRLAGIRTLGSPLRPVRQPDGKVLVAAAIQGDRGDPMQVALARFKRSGQPDPTFGRGGRVRLGAHWNFDPRDLQVLPDGRIVLMGAAGAGNDGLYSLVGPAQIGLLRLLPDGSRDRTFGTNGFLAWNPPWRGNTQSMQTLPGLLVRQADGRLLVAASVDELQNSGQLGINLVEVKRVAFVRFNENGSVDESFGRAGVIEGPGWLEWPPSAWAALPDGHLVGLHQELPDSWWLDRFNPDGTLDRGFGQDGSVRLGSFGFAWITALVAARDGSLVVMGDDQRGHTATVLRRILPAGQLDAEFGTACGRPPLRALSSGGAAATSDGRVLVTGTTYVVRGRYDILFGHYDARGCVADRLRVRAVSAGPPLIRGPHRAIVGATYNHAHAAYGSHDTLALIRIRR